jgi:hypothetical protein
MQTVGMSGRMPFQNLDQGPCFACGRHGWKSGSLTRFESKSPSRGTGPFQRYYKIPNGFGLADRLRRQSHAKCTLYSQDELGSSQTVDAQIALDAA